MKVSRLILLPVLSTIACAPTVGNNSYIPALRYSPNGGAPTPSQTSHLNNAPPAQHRIGRSHDVVPSGQQEQSNLYRPTQFDGRASLHLVDGDVRPDFQQQLPRGIRRSPELLGEDIAARGTGASGPGDQGDIPIYRSVEQLPPPYKEPLPLGDPGISASLWHESRGNNEIFRDFRAWQPMDIVTIVVSERSRGIHDADTLTNSRSSVEAAIENLLGLEAQTKEWKRPPSLTNTVNAATRNEFRGEGETRRQAELTARISAVVAEVLPSGLLRVEGEKIISVNNEEQVMVISGLVRTRDINSNNEVNSASIAQMRIDYYGKGIVGEVQYGGWLGRLMRLLWPF
jgi:flagellar L-ring protein precursor FlgH